MLVAAVDLTLYQWLDKKYKSNKTCPPAASNRCLLARPSTLNLPKRRRNGQKKTGSFSLIERVILSAGAMLIFSVSLL